MNEALLRAEPSAAQSACLLFIAGAWCEGATTVAVLDKFSGEAHCVAHLPARSQVTQCVQNAHRAYRSHALEPHARAAILERAAALVEQRAASFEYAMLRDAGFTASDAGGEIKRCATTLRLCAEEARNFCGEMIPLSGVEGQTGRIGFTLRVPLGVVCAITPFNSPLNTVAHKIGPALAAGNSVILKPSLHTPMAANLLVQALLDAGLPPNLISLLHGGPQVVGWLLEEPQIRFFAFTGSTDAGRSIQQRSGLRRTQMELGSIAHCILFEDADLDRALPKIVNAAYRKAGQVCTSIQILLVQRSLLSTVEERLARMVSALPFGNPAKAETVVGPVVSREAAMRIESWIDEAVSMGARKLAGGQRMASVIPPTLLSGVPAEAAVLTKEVFGPVMCIVPFDTLQEAVERVNSTPYGLASGVFTNQLNKAFEVARTLDVGGVHINETSSSRVDLMPFGGTKESGFGREGPRHSVREMSEERMVTLLP